MAIDPGALDSVRDIEETSEELDRDTGEAAPLEPLRRREVLTSVVEYSLTSLTQLLSSGRINLSPRYQRRARWGPDRQSRLIESFVMNVPVPPIYLNEDRRGAFSVIDGKQRLLSIQRFFGNDLRLDSLTELPELNGLTLATLPEDIRSSLETLPSLRTIIVLADSNPKIKYEVFLRLNRGGVQLNAQEIRNSSWPGPLNDLILDLSETERFRRMLRVADPDRSVLVREMRDAELVLRYFTFQRTWQDFTGGVATTMNGFMEDNQYLGVGALGRLKGDFERALDCVEAALGDRAFRRWVPETQAWRNQVLAALFDAEMLGLTRFSPGALTAIQPAFEAQFITLFENSDFRSSIDAATNTPALLQRRVQTVFDLAARTLD